MIKSDYKKVEEISIEGWNKFFDGSYIIQPLIFGYKLKIKNGEISYKHQKINLVNRLLNKHIDKLYIEALKIKQYFKNCFVILFEDKIFIDAINEKYCDDIIIRLGYYPINKYIINHKVFILSTPYETITQELYNSAYISDNFRNTVFGFKIFNENKNTVIQIRTKEKEKEGFVVDDLYKFYYNFITNFIAQEFRRYSLKYHNNISDLDERSIWIATKLSFKISLLEPTFKDEHLKQIIKPFEDNINYDKIPSLIGDYTISNLFIIILSILHNKTIKSGFLESNLEHIHRDIQNFIQESYCEHMYFVDNFDVLAKFK